MEPARLEADLATVIAAALAAVDPERLVRRRLAVAEKQLTLDGGRLYPPCELDPAGRVVIVGGGKAAAALAAGVVTMLAAGGVAADRIAGLISVPEGSGRSIPGVDVRETRPPGVNLPTERAVAASREMLSLVAGLGPADTVIAVISGGGSAVLAAPRAGVSLAEKAAIAGFLAAAGADIREINTVRRAASDIKGGGLARACSAGQLVALVLSDVIGDPLEFIASGPCLPGDDATAALAVLERYGAIAAGVAAGLVSLLRAELRRGPVAQPDVSTAGSWTTPRGCRVEHVLLGSNATAVDAAAAAATGLGYEVVVRHAFPGASETADEVGARLAREGLHLAAEAGADSRPRAVVEGGEAVVRLPAEHGRGGRNQQTAAAAARAVRQMPAVWPERLAVASLGTDGEDGPTTAAGGSIDAAVAEAIAEQGLDLDSAVTRCDAHPLLTAAGGLIETGPTGTNVADLRIMLVR